MIAHEVGQATCEVFHSKVPLAVYVNGGGV
jgi:hypothetical protein